MNVYFLKSRSYFLSLIFFSVVLILFLSVVASAQSTSTTTSSQSEGGLISIVFPITELGSCSSKLECKKYCEDSTHAAACTAFAESRGLIKKDQADRARDFQTKLRMMKQGPGRCDSPQACRDYCSKTENIKECIAFAETQGLSNQRIEAGKKFLQVIASGVETPGSCKSEKECKVYCEDFAHAEECSVFAEKLGFSGREREMGGDNFLGREAASKLTELVKSGETPGACKSKSECEAYCKDQSHAAECADFALKVGSLRPEQVERIKKFANGGPGGCQGPEACKEFCDKEDNRRICYDFAKVNNLIPQEQVERMRQNALRLKESISQASSEVRQCILSVLPQEVVSRLDSGELPDHEFGSRVRDCFEKNLRSESIEVPRAFQLPPRVIECLSKSISKDRIELLKTDQMLREELYPQIKQCVEEVGDQRTRDDKNSFGSQESRFPMMNGVPDVVKKCAAEKAGLSPSQISDFVDGGLRDSGTGITRYIGECMQVVGPRQNSSDQFFGTTSEKSGSVAPRLQNMRTAPASRVVECVQMMLGKDYEARVQSGELAKSDVESIFRKCAERNESAFPFDFPGKSTVQSEESRKSPSEISPFGEMRGMPGFRAPNEVRSEDRFPGSRMIDVPVDSGVKNRGGFGIPGQSVMPRPLENKDVVLPGVNIREGGNNEGGFKGPGFQGQGAPSRMFMPQPGDLPRPSVPDVKPLEVQPAPNQGGNFVEILRNFVDRFSR